MKTTITIIGAGSMGGAIAQAVLKSKKPWALTVINKSPEKLSALKKKYRGVSVSAGYDSLAQADVIILAVKPQSFSELATNILPFISKKALVVSIMAGVSIQKIQKELGIKRVIHAMPNLGAQFFESMTVWAGDKLTSADKVFSKEFFSLLGEELYVKNEDLVNKTTAASASGVGFLTYIIEAYIAETISLGFTPKEAEKMVLQTLRATNTLLQKKERTPAETRIAVTSKKGTTEAGLSVLMDTRLQKIIGKTLQKAYKRANELSKE